LVARKAESMLARYLPPIRISSQLHPGKSKRAGEIDPPVHGGSARGTGLAGSTCSMSRSTGPALMPPRSDEASDMAASASTPVPAAPHHRAAPGPPETQQPRAGGPLASTPHGRRGRARRNEGWSLAATCGAGGDELGARRGSSEVRIGARRRRGRGRGTRGLAVRGRGREIVTRRSQEREEERRRGGE